MKKTAGGVLIGCAVSLILVLCLQASGGILIFSNRDQWAAANNGDIDIFQDFSAYNFQESADVTKNIAFPGFSLLQDPGFTINFADSADLYASPLTPMLLTFDHGLFGFAADIEVLDGALELKPLSDENDPVFAPRTGFFGILSDHPLYAINFSSADAFDFRLASDPTVHFQLDNVSLAQVTPEPASLIIWGAGFLAAVGYVAIRRHGRQQCAKV